MIMVAWVTAAKTKDKLPSCNDARVFYEKSKLYDALGVKKTAKDAEIKKAFRKMSVKCHPDKDSDNPKAEDNFIAIAGAYQTLSDETERRRYDQLGTLPKDQPHPQQHQQQGGAGGQWQRRQYSDINVDDIFSSFFGGGSPGGRSSGGFSFNFDGGEEDTQFANMFRGFNFANRKKSSGHASKQQHAGQGGTFGGNFGGNFGNAGAGGMPHQRSGSKPTPKAAPGAKQSKPSQSGGSTQKNTKPQTAKSSKESSSGNSKKDDLKQQKSQKPNVHKNQQSKTSADSMPYATGHRANTATPYPKAHPSMKNTRTKARGDL